MSNFDFNNQYQGNNYGGTTAGGFVNNYGASQGGGGSQNSPGSASKTYGKDTLRPVTIKQLVDAQQPHPDAEFKIDGTEITQVTFIGQIRNISTQATNYTYKLDDGTGTIEVKQWIDPEAVNSLDIDEAVKSKLTENTYARVLGRLRFFGNKRHVASHVIRPIADMNEIQYHLLEATVVHLYFSRGPPEQLNGAAANTESRALDVGTSGGSFGGKQLPPMSGTARKVLQVINDSPQNNEGLHMQIISSKLGISPSEILKAGDELQGLGLIYTTVDDDTWAMLEF
ncbi:MAG: replication factor A protein 2 [Trizodia sp. TS-e1964]|nr:MAG: replication factor A protein 2 [Trizodia sp. TS-e1964]